MGKNKKQKTYMIDDEYDYSDIEYNNKKKKNKKKKKTDDEYDYSDINYSGDIRKLMKQMANSLECYIDFIETYAIFEGITEDEWQKNVKNIKKLIKKLRKGDPSVFDINNMNEVLTQGHQLVIGLAD